MVYCRGEIESFPGEAGSQFQRGSCVAERGFQLTGAQTNPEVKGIVHAEAHFGEEASSEETTPAGWVGSESLR